MKYETTHWGSHVFPTNIDWADIDKKAGDKSYLCKLGLVGVDGASVKVTFGDTVCPIQFEAFTPEGDGSYAVLVGKIEGIGRVMLVAFDDEKNGE